MKDSAWLSWVEREVEQSTTGSGRALPPALFHCQLEDQPDHLVPAYAFGPKTLGRESAGRLVVNPNLVWTRDAWIPSELKGEIAHLDGFALQGAIAWVRDRLRNRIHPFWLGEDVLERLLKMKTGLLLAQECFSELMVSALSRARILLEPGLEGRELETWQKKQLWSSSQFEERGFVPIAGLLHPFHLSALRRYYRHLLRSGGLRFGDSQSGRRYVAHNEAVARFFHHQLTGTVSAIVGREVKPSYVYVASYQEGADLEKHTDREQCEFSISYCLDFSPEPCDETSWPLLLHTDRGTVRVFQRIGDGLIYRGTQVPHSRERLGDGHTSTSIFFHYVSSDFSGSLD